MKSQYYFYSLLMGCPFEQPVNDCKFEKFRVMPLTELIETVRLFSEREFQEMVDSHAECYRKRTLHKAAS